MKAQFCSVCGSPLKNQKINNEERTVCLQCDRIHYDQLIIGAGGIVERKGCLLLIQRSADPFKGDYGLPSGHVDVDENPADAAAREVHEETGLHVEIGDLLGVYFFDDHPRGKGIHIVYRCHIVGGELRETAEGTNPSFFTREQIPHDLAGGGHNQAISSWKDRGYLHQKQVSPIAIRYWKQKEVIEMESKSPDETKQPTNNTQKTLMRSEMWLQLTNAINLRSSQDQVLWSIFGTFWAANAILLVALFTTGNLPSNPAVGIVISVVGLFLSLTWHAIQARALGHIIRHEELIRKIEVELGFDTELAVSPEINRQAYSQYFGRLPRARKIMAMCSIGGAFLWALAIAFFVFEVLMALR